MLDIPRNSQQQATDCYESSSVYPLKIDGNVLRTVKGFGLATFYQS